MFFSPSTIFFSRSFINFLFLLRPLEFEWNFRQDLSAILVKQEEPDIGQRLDPPLEGLPLVLSPAPPHRGSAWRQAANGGQDEAKTPLVIKDEPQEMGQYLSLPPTGGCTNTHTRPGISKLRLIGHTQPVKLLIFN